MRSQDAKWWRETARDDWGAFEVLKREANYPAAVFHLQQAAEKILKAVCYQQGQPAFTHSTVEILRKLESIGLAVSEEFKGCARRLDPHHITARYPNAVGGIPRDFYDLPLVEELEAWTKTLMNFAESKLSDESG
ncbi:HEPN domain-containing protein [Acidobacteria bacterium AH-259-L09]|nr:HEPN domain-containing protein [Acidobacteria bacterium AH-259-L09]